MGPSLNLYGGKNPSLVLWLSVTETGSDPTAQEPRGSTTSPPAGLLRVLTCPETVLKGQAEGSGDTMRTLGKEGEATAGGLGPGALTRHRVRACAHPHRPTQGTQLPCAAPWPWPFARLNLAAT